MKKRLHIVMTLLLFVSIFYLSRQGAALQAEYAASIPASDPPVVVLDAGHGNIDPGKVGADGALEKEINLSITQYLKEYLEESGVTVVLTRKDDSPLYKETDSNKKRGDMSTRIAIIEEADPAIVVSIHQNSYPDSSVSGPQVFYYSASKEGKSLAETIQKSFSYAVEEKKIRTAKANQDYYLLIHTPCPTVICECGFLSNPEECAKLQQEEYQKKVAWSVYLGIMEYLNLPVNQ